MKAIEELYERLHSSENEKGNIIEKSFEERYPAYEQNDNKIHVLYISPCINGTGFYRMILPMLELNKTSTHKAIITNLHKWNFSKQFEDYDNPIDTRLIKWANYIVFPSMYVDATETFNSFRSINKEVQIIMDIDTNVHRYPKEHPNYAKITQEVKRNFLENMGYVDLVTGASEELLGFYTQLYEKYASGKEIYMEYIPNLISNFGLEEVATIKQNETKKIRIGIIGNLSNHYDTLSIKDVLIEIGAKHKDKIELLFFGWNGKLPNGDEPLKGLQFSFIKSVSFMGYYPKLNGLVFDFVLLPLAKIPFNTHGKSFVKYLELAAFAVPVIASKLPPYVHAIEQEENGMLAATTEEWVTAIEKLIDDKDFRYALGRAALKNAWRNFSYTTKNLNHLKEFFI